MSQTHETHNRTVAPILQLPKPLLEPSHQALTVSLIPFQAKPQEGSDNKWPEEGTSEVELAVRACRVTCDRTGEGGPAQGCRVKCAGLPALVETGSLGPAVLLVQGSLTVGGWVWAVPPGPGAAEGAGAGWDTQRW